jgi:hypothetical protein
MAAVGVGAPKNNYKGNNYKINKQHSRLVYYSSVYYLSTGTGGPIPLNDTLETMKGELFSYRPSKDNK